MMGKHATRSNVPFIPEDKTPRHKKRMESKQLNKLQNNLRTVQYAYGSQGMDAFDMDFIHNFWQ